MLLPAAHRLAFFPAVTEEGFFSSTTFSCHKQAIVWIYPGSSTPHASSGQHDGLPGTETEQKGNSVPLGREQRFVLNTCLEQSQRKNIRGVLGHFPTSRCPQGRCASGDSSAACSQHASRSPNPGSPKLLRLHLLPPPPHTSASSPIQEVIPQPLDTPG